MKKILVNNAKYLFVGIGISIGVLLLSSWRDKKQNQEEKKEVVTPTTNLSSNALMSFSALDVAAENLIPGNKIYHRSEALELKKSLEQMYLANPNDMAVNMALVRFHACAPNFAGGFVGVAKQHAATIFRQNPYVGCLAYEYIYHVNNDYIHAEEWYKLSLASRTVEGMEWREVAYSKSVNFGVGVKGSFSNNKIQPLYQNVYGTHKRKIMMPKCGSGACEFTLVPGFLRGASATTTGKLIFTPY